MHHLRIVFFAAISSIAITQAAVAADMPVKAPAGPAAALYNWHGFYVGGHVGYGWGSDPITLTPSPLYAPSFALGAFPSSIADNPKGVLGGIQYGSNWQFNRIVLGLESDFALSDINASQTLFNTVNPAGITNFGNQKLSWFSTTRGRAGYTITDNLLLYGTGGLAAGRAHASSSVVAGTCEFFACPAGSASDTLWGWTAGGGLEYGIGHWSVRLEYLHYDLGDLNYNMTDPRLPGGFIAASTRFSGDLVRGGINYRFDWTPLELILGRRL